MRANNPIEKVNGKIKDSIQKEAKEEGKGNNYGWIEKKYQDDKYKHSHINNYIKYKWSKRTNQKAKTTRIEKIQDLIIYCHKTPT